MIRLPRERGAAPGAPTTPLLSAAAIAKWLIAMRLVAMSALFIGALLVQAATEEILPIVPVAWVAGLTYLLSLLWLALWALDCPPRLHGALQLIGDLAIVGALIYVTGGLASPFPFLLLLPVCVAALMLGLRAALTTAGGAFAVYGLIAVLQLYNVLPAPPALGAVPFPPLSSLSFQLSVNAAGFALAALLTSYLAHSVQESEQRLRSEREATERLFALSGDVLDSVDSGVLAADSGGTVVLANPAAARILRREHIAAGGALAEILPLDGVSWPAVLDQLTDRGSSRVEGVLGESGTPVGCTVSPLRGQDGTLLGAVVHFRDLTETREVARQDRLRARLVAVGQMAAGIAHEIRNPLASISGSAQVLGALPQLGDREQRLLHIIVDESRRLSGIVDSFLGYARPPEMERRPCQLWRTLDETLTLFSNSPEVTPKHRIETDIHPHPAPLLADEKQMRQAFFNLARNAVEAMPSGGTMRVAAHPDGAAYVIRWSDEGVGMESDQLEEIFQPFKAFRTGGTGLGLSVVYSIVADHGGEIQVESTPGQGTCFIVLLPLEPA